MLKITILLVAIALVNAGCPHGLSRLKSEQNRPGGGNNNGGNNNGGNNNGGNPRPRPTMEDGNGQNGNQNNDRRPKPTSERPQPPPQTGDCNENEKYYTIDGRCNNIETPVMGMAETTFKRYLPAEYEDDISLSRTKASNGNDLPNPRDISVALLSDNMEFENDYSDLLVYFGQWLAHDLTEILLEEDADGSVICPCGSTNPLCLSYDVNDDGLDADCLEFTRAKAEIHDGHYEQVNFLTSWIDGTQVYGFSAEIEEEVREHEGGRMKTSVENYLPRDPNDLFCSPNFDLECFVGGESRASENLALTSVHTLFMREHNRLADLLHARHNTWNDEQLFQEARRINIAEMQHIIYNEWLPLVVGTNTDLKPDTDGYYNGYNPDVNGALSNEFATATFRFGHTLIRDNIDRYTLLHQNLNAPVNLSDIVFDSTQATQNGGLESIMSGLLSQPTSKYDASLVTTLQNHLFEFDLGDDTTFALDLPATNVNRGRDHALAPYYKYAEMCGERIRRWSDLDNIMSRDNREALSDVYDSWRDIDLFIGGLHETPERGALVGPTFACIIEKQFEDLRDADRLYYEHGHNAETRFSERQLSELKHSSMARLLCDNFGFTTIQSDAFKMPSNSNARTLCRDLPRVSMAEF